MAKTFRRIQRPAFLAWIVTILYVFGACDDLSHKVRQDLAFTGLYDFKYVRTIPPFGNALYTIVVEVTNQGTVSVQRVKVVANYKGPGIERDCPPLDKNGYYYVAAGETIKVRFQFIFEKQLGGEYEFTVIVDPSNAVQEENESNNRLVFNRRF